jgi:hypothetical protein
MSIHDFHSQLISGKEEGGLIEALRRMTVARGLVALMAETNPWSIWSDAEEGGGSLCAASS